MIFRPYSPSDRERCHEVFSSNVPEYFVSEELEIFMQGLDENKWDNFHVLEDDSRVVGFGGFTFRRGNSARFIWGAIHNDLHKKGYGKVLTEFRIKAIRKLNRTIPITLETTDLTYQFFQRFGFEIVEVKEKFYFGKYDKYEMILKQ